MPTLVILETESCDGFKLAQEIVALSAADNWNSAKPEWTLDHIFISEELGVCLCGHFPIREFCVIRNQKNGNEAIVGNVCVRRFLGLPTDKLFSAFHRIAGDPKRALNAEAVEYAYQKDWMNDWSHGFYMNTMRQRKLSPRQQTKRIEINRAVLYWFRKGQA